MTKLMLVEDDNNLREIYEARLQAEGYSIVSARDGEEALVVAKAEKPDLIISDVMMPKISGFEMLDILRNTDGLKNIKIIMLTALGQSDDQQRADRLGADRYLVKSQVTLEDIVKVTHELLGDSGGAPAVAAATPTEPAATTPPAPVVPEPSAPIDPAPTPEPIPAPVPAPVPEPTDKTDDTAQSTAQEEAAVEARIEDFVAGATEQVTTPEVSPALPPEIDNTTAPEIKIEAVPEPVPEPELPRPKKVGGERVIEPLAGEPKKDLDVLLAVEEAKETPVPTTPTAIVVNDKTGPEPAVNSPGSVDPNSIAL